jgi:hypothetical protein
MTPEVTLIPLQHHLHLPRHQEVTQMHLHPQKRVPIPGDLLTQTQWIHREIGLFTSDLSSKLSTNLHYFHTFFFNRTLDDEETTNDLESERETNKRRRKRDTSDLKDVSYNIDQKLTFLKIGYRANDNQNIFHCLLQLINDNPDMYGVRRSARSRKEPDRFMNKNVSF